MIIIILPYLQHGPYVNLHLHKVDHHAIQILDHLNVLFANYTAQKILLSKMNGYVFKKRYITRYNLKINIFYSCTKLIEIYYEKNRNQCHIINVI